MGHNHIQNSAPVQPLIKPQEGISYFSLPMPVFISRSLALGRVIISFTLQTYHKSLLMENPTGWLEQSRPSSDNSELPIQLHASGLENQMGI